MSHSSIYDKGWLNLVFEGRNKTYGAYQLRRQEGRNTLMAFGAALLLIATIAGGPALAARLTGKTPGKHTDNVPPLKEDSIRVVTVDLKKLKSEEPAPSRKPLMAETKPARRFVNMRPSATPDAVNPSTTDEIRESIIASTDAAGTAGGTDNAPTTTATGNGNGEAPSTDAGDGNEPIANGLLDKNPEFPGGIQKFYQYVGRTFRAPEETDGAGQIRVLVSFVVERDGSLTDIKVLRNPGYGVDREAIRVLKALKTKWNPGIYRGEKVRTLYTLPISVEPSR